MSILKININKVEYEVDVDPSTPLLWVLRDTLNLTGTKYGCGKGLCGACTVHIDGIATRSCVQPIESVEKRKITTIEGLAEDGNQNSLQKAWVTEDVPQCGYCQAGFIMTASSFLRKNPNPTDEEIILAMSNNICRCGTYNRIKRAIKGAIKDTNK